MVVDGIVERRVCFYYFSDCCFFKRIIKVFNCFGYYVYELKRMWSCYLRYCIMYNGKYCDF